MFGKNVNERNCVEKFKGCFTSQSPFDKDGFQLDKTRREPKIKQTSVISTNPVIFERGFTVPGWMYANLLSYRSYLPDCAGLPPLPGPPVKWPPIGAQKTAAMATSCLAIPPMEEVDGGDAGLQVCAQTDTRRHLWVSVWGWKSTDWILNLSNPSMQPKPSSSTCF